MGLVAFTESLEIEYERFPGEDNLDLCEYIPYYSSSTQGIVLLLFARQNIVVAKVVDLRRSSCWCFHTSFFVHICIDIN